MRTTIKWETTTDKRFNTFKEAIKAGFNPFQLRCLLLLDSGVILLKQRFTLDYRYKFPYQAIQQIQEIYTFEDIILNITHKD